MKALEILNRYHHGVIHCDESELDEAIAELKALQQPKSCTKCAWFRFDEEFNDGYGQCFYDIHFPNSESASYHKGTDFYCSEFEPKEQ